MVAVGSLFYLQDDGFFRDRHGGRATCRDPWQLKAYLNGVMHAARRDPDTGRWRDSVWSGRSDMAVVRSLRSGRRRTVAVRLLAFHDELGLTKGATACPTLPAAPARQHAA